MCRLILCLLTSEAKIKANELTCSKHEGWISFHLHVNVICNVNMGSLLLSSPPPPSSDVVTKSSSLLRPSNTNHITTTFSGANSA
ncbi:unnamed protein product [Musa acuminata subsp. malaccensis]|uniref:(wild Malaysian banana) hypothetical protein n=1 Tax=Musa acuminata subsp. malaccensis TaxID=214687 RepID=A0A804KXB0_MUSAM|nr:unnamed protein product [Musa acuminata subsp. malaccensis]